MILFLVGCISQEIYYKQYDISLEVVNATSGAAHNATLLFEWFGQGELRYPMYPIEEVSFDGDGLQNWEVLVEEDLGEGLALFVWEDVDDDGVHCSLDNRTERSGLVVFDDSQIVVEQQIELSSECLGFERLFELQ